MKLYAFKIDSKIVMAATMQQAQGMVDTFDPETSKSEYVGDTFLDAHIEGTETGTLRPLVEAATQPGIIYDFEIVVEGDTEQD